jgi:predicted enzyme related to lactoylglutathione lyase
VVDVHGRFAWYELITTDVAAAKTFYTAVMGWSAWDAPAPGRPYVVFTAGNAAVGGLMSLPQDARDMGVTPCWIGYVGVDDVDASAERVKRLGGVIHVPPTDVGNISRFAIFSDPQAARLALVQWRQGGRPPLAEPDAPGRVGWHELLAADGETALTFYEALFGWQKADHESDATGTYQLFAAGGETIGGMVAKPATVPSPFWLYYFNVGDVDAAAQRVTSGGGRIISAAAEMPGGSWIVQCTDPQGAMFALEGQRGPIGYFARTGSPGARGRWSW